MKREKHVIVEDINSTDDAVHIVLEHDVEYENKKNDVECYCFNKTIIKYWLDFLRHYLD